MGNNRVKNYDELSEIEKEDLRKYGGSYRSSGKPDAKQVISDEFNAPYNASEDIPKEFRGGSIDQSYNRYAEQNPIHGNFLKLKRIIGRGLNGGNEK